MAREPAFRGQKLRIGGRGDGVQGIHGHSIQMGKKKAGIFRTRSSIHSCC